MNELNYQRKNTNVLSMILTHRTNITNLCYLTLLSQTEIDLFFFLFWYSDTNKLIFSIVLKCNNELLFSIDRNICFILAAHHVLHHKRLQSAHKIVIRYVRLYEKCSYSPMLEFESRNGELSTLYESDL